MVPLTVLVPKLPVLLEHPYMHGYCLQPESLDILAIENEMHLYR